MPVARRGAPVSAFDDIEPLPPSFVPARFPKSARLCDSEVFRRVLRGRKRIQGPLELAFARRPDTQVRLGLVASSRYLPRAVDRNALRRIVREQFRHRRHALSGLDVVVRLRCSLRDKDGWRQEVTVAAAALLEALE